LLKVAGVSNKDDNYTTTTTTKTTEEKELPLSPVAAVPAANDDEWRGWQ
jgi:hypothetical protein